MSDLLNRIRSLALQIKKNIAPDIDKNPRHRDKFAELIPEINKHLASIDAMNSSLEILNGQYHEKFMKQEEMLQNLIFSVNKHILACFESLKYKRSLLKEITAMLDKTKDYLYNGGLALLTIAAIKAFGDSCEDIESGVSISSDTEKINSIEYFREYILLIKEYFLKRAENDDYKTKMIISFLSEFSVHHKEGI
jgi:hypothetical protein